VTGKAEQSREVASVNRRSHISLQRAHIKVLNKQEISKFRDQETDRVWKGVRRPLISGAPTQREGNIKKEAEKGRRCPFPTCRGCKKGRSRSPDAQEENDTGIEKGKIVCLEGRRSRKQWLIPQLKHRTNKKGRKSHGCR